MNHTHARRLPLPLALAAVLATALAVLAVPVPTSAAEPFAQWAWDRTAASCAGALQGDTVNFDGGARCVGDRLGGLLVEEAARLMTEQGQRMFGAHFSLVHRMTWSPLGQGLAGELDAVIPLGFRGGGVPAGAGAAEALHGSAFFLQQGVTRWTDAHGLRRHDLRLGTAVRFALPHFAGADVVGAMAMVQENVERGHRPSSSAPTTPGAGARPRCSTTCRRRSGARGGRATRSAPPAGPSSASAST